MRTLSAPLGANHQSCPGLPSLPFGGLGLDLAEARRKASGLLLAFFRPQEKPRQEIRFQAPPPPSGYELLLRLCRETLGS